METRIKILALAIIGTDYLQDLEKPLKVIIKACDNGWINSPAVRNALKRLEAQVVKRSNIVAEIYSN